MVVGLQFCGIDTISSCQGHRNRGLRYPWVAVPYSFAEKLAKVVGWQNRPVLRDGRKNENIWVIRPNVNLRLMLENRNLPLEELQKQAIELGIFLQNLPDKRFPKNWFKNTRKNQEQVQMTALFYSCIIDKYSFFVII